MAVSDAEYAVWLASSGKTRCVLAELDVYAGGGVVTRYFSNLGFVSAPTDTPASTAYPELLVKLPVFYATIGELTRGRTTVSFGELLLDNSNGDLDTYVDDIVDGRAIRMYLGDPSWPKSDFRPLMTGQLRDVQARGWNKLVYTIRDKQLTLSKPLRSTVITGSSSQVNLRSPVCYGECKNITPVLIDGATRRYKVHDGQIQSIDAVYTDGVSGTARTDDLANGEFTLNAAPTGRITCDVKGSKSGGTYVNSTADIIYRILTERAGFSAGEIGSLTSLNTDAPGAVGFYSAADGNEMLFNALDTLAMGAGAYYYVDRNGVFQMSQFKAPSGTPVLTLTADDIALRGVDLRQRILPSSSVRLGYARNWTPTFDGASSALTAAQRESLGQTWKVVRATNSLPTFLLADDERTEPTCFVSSSDAQTEATRRATLWSVQRKVFGLQAFVPATTLKLGDVVALDVGRWGLTGGTLARVITLNESPTDAAVELEVFL